MVRASAKQTAVQFPQLMHSFCRKWIFLFSSSQFTWWASRKAIPFLMFAAAVSGAGFWLVLSLGLMAVNMLLVMISG